jgi:Predicted exonuclease
MQVPSPFVSAAALRWQRSIADLREYEVIRDGNVFDSHLARSSIFSSEYERAQRLKSDLVQQYPEPGLESVFEGKEIQTASGSAYCIQSHHDAREVGWSRGHEEALLYDLTLIRGIGPATARHLQERGYSTIRDLLGHPKFRIPAAHYLSHYEARDTGSLMNWIGSRHHRSHPLILTLADCMDRESFCFLDIETLGIFSRPIILLGLAHLRGERVQVRQFLLRDIEEEPSALEAAFSAMQESQAYVTFNGKSFDIPSLQERAAYYGIPFFGDLPHFDLLHFSRRQWKGMLANCRLQTLERSLFGMERGMDVPGALVPEFYEAYLTSGSPGPLVPIVEHNRQDVLSLVHLFWRLREDSLCQ